MRWGDHHFLYARPIRWIVALLDNELYLFLLNIFHPEEKHMGIVFMVQVHFPLQMRKISKKRFRFL